jgi:hypothetical protein
LLAQRQMENEGLLAAEQAPELVAAKKDRYAASFLERLRKFFEL